MIRTVKFCMETSYERIEMLPVSPMSPGLNVAIPDFAPMGYLSFDGAKWIYSGAFDEQDVEAFNFILFRNRGKFMKINVDSIRDIQKKRYQLIVEMHIDELTHEERQARSNTAQTRESPALVGGRRMRLRSEG